MNLMPVILMMLKLEIISLKKMKMMIIFIFAKKREQYSSDSIYDENIFFFCENNRGIYAKELPKGKKYKLAEAPFDVKGMFFHEGTLRLFGTHLEYAVAEVSIAE